MFDYPLNGPTLALSVISAVTAVATTYYTLIVAQKPKVYARSTTLKSFLDHHVVALRSKFYPSPLFLEGRLQTIFGLSHRVTEPNKLEYDRELFSLSDGGEVALDHMKADNLPNVQKPFLVLLLPGLTSSSQTSYVRTLVLALKKIGATVVVFNNRGNGGVPFKTPKTYSASYIGDLEEVIPHVRNKYADHRMIAIGTSLGGMVLAKYLTNREENAKKYFECAILISIAWDCVEGSNHLEKPFINKFIINRALTEGLLKLAKRFLRNFEDVPLKFDPKNVLKAKTVRQFDAAVTAPQFGFANVEDYYKDATTSGNIHKFSIPVFALSAQDDPMQPGHLLPTEEAEKENSKLALIVTSRGGHLGWIEGFRKHSNHYMERIVQQLVEAIRIEGTPLP